MSQSKEVAKGRSQSRFVPYVVLLALVVIGAAVMIWTQSATISNEVASPTVSSNGSESLYEQVFGPGNLQVLQESVDPSASPAVNLANFQNAYCGDVAQYQSNPISVVMRDSGFDAQVQPIYADLQASGQLPQGSFADNVSGTCTEFYQYTN